MYLYDILNYPIIFGKGIGDIQINGSEKNFVAKYIAPFIEEISFEEHIIVREMAHGTIIYTIFDSISVYVDLESHKIFQIYLYGDFKSDFFGVISIGKKLNELLDFRKDIYFDDEYLLVGKTSGLILQIEDSVHRLSLTELGAKEIQSIAIQDMGIVPPHAQTIFEALPVS